MKGGEWQADLGGVILIEMQCRDVLSGAYSEQLSLLARSLMAILALL